MRARTVAVLLAGALVAASVLAVGLLASDAHWRTAWDELHDPAPAAAAADGPVLVLGGSGERLPFALTLPDVPGPTRPLWLSALDDRALEEHGLSCADPHVVCAQPVPASTYGEALLLARLAAELAPGVTVTVVTSTFHVARTRYQFATCPGPDVVVVSPAAGTLPGEPDRAELLKLVNAGLRTSCRGATLPAAAATAAGTKGLP